MQQIFDCYVMKANTMLSRWNTSSNGRGSSDNPKDELGSERMNMGNLGVAGRMANSVTWVRGGVLKRAERATNPCSKVGEKDEEVTGER